MFERLEARILNWVLSISRRISASFRLGNCIRFLDLFFACHLTPRTVDIGWDLLVRLHLDCPVSNGLFPQRSRLSDVWSRGRPLRTIVTIEAAAVTDMSDIAHITEVTQILTRQSRQTLIITCKSRSPQGAWLKKICNKTWFPSQNMSSNFGQEMTNYFGTPLCHKQL